MNEPKHAKLHGVTIAEDDYEMPPLLQIVIVSIVVGVVVFGGLVFCLWTAGCTCG